MEVWYILIFNVRRMMRMIILLQSVTMQFLRLFWHISYYKVGESNFITNCRRLLLQSESGITKWEVTPFPISRGALKFPIFLIIKKENLIKETLEFRDGGRYRFGSRVLSGVLHEMSSKTRVVWVLGGDQAKNHKINNSNFLNY